MKDKEKKIIIGLIVGMFAILAITFSITYAFWQTTKEQTETNIVNTTCLNISLLNQENDINIPKAYPISDTDGKELQPFTFTVQNNCEEWVDYSINLEVLKETTLASSYVKAMLNIKDTEGTPQTLDYYGNGTQIIEDSKESKTLLEDKLGPKSKGANTKDYELRLWLSESVTIENDAMNKTFQSKIVIDGKVGEEPKASDEICSKAGKDSGACYLAKKADEDTTNFAYDETVDNNLRYIGATPNNYIHFNCEAGKAASKSTCETWRIIGIMNNIEDENGNTGSHIKIIRDKFEKNYSWDSSASGVNSGNGVNEWSEADIEKVLNDEYLYRRTGSNLCYKSSSNSTETCPDWANIGIRESSRNMISRVKWNTGTMSVKYDGNTNLITASYMYEAERSNHTGKELCQASGGTYCNDGVSRTTTWTGKVGLMYPSDYGYAVGGTARTTCLGKIMNSYSSDNCKTNDWLYDANNYQWTMTPVPYSSHAGYVFYVDSSGNVRSTPAYSALAVRPVVYLASNVKIKSNDDQTYGSVGNPFVLEM